MRWLRLGALAAATLALTACGGGGSGEGRVPPPPAPAPAPAPAPSPAPAPAPAPAPSPAPAPAAPTGLGVFLGDEAALTDPARDGRGREARFEHARSISVDTQGNAWVAEWGSGKVRFVAADGQVSTVSMAGGPPACAGKAVAVKLAHDGGILVSVPEQRVVCHKAAGGAVTIRVPDIGFGGAGEIATGPGDMLFLLTAEGVFRHAPGAAAQRLLGPEFHTIASSPDGVLFAGDGSRIVQVDGNTGASTLVATAGPDAGFGPLVVDSAGSLLTLGPSRQSPYPLVLQRVRIPGGPVVLPATTGLILWQPFVALGRDGHGRIYYAHGPGVGRITEGGDHEQVAGRLMTGPGAPVAEVPIGVDSAGNVWTQSEVFPTVRVRKFAPDGRMLPIGPAGDGLLLSERFTSAAVDGEDNLVLVFARFAQIHQGGFTFIRGRPTNTEIYRVTPTGEVRQSLSTVRGDIRFFSPIRVGFDGQGRMVFGDAETNTVRRLLPDGSHELLGAGLFADPNLPAEMAVSASGRVALVSSSRQVHTLQADGTLAVLAGDAGAPAGVADGTGTQARFGTPAAPVFDSAGNLWLADGHTIRRVSPQGSVTTVAGRPQAAFNTLGSLPATVFAPYSLQLGPGGLLYFRSASAVLRLALP